MAYFRENGIFAWAQGNTASNANTLRDSYNMTSLTDVSTGRIRFNFSTNAVNNDYAIVSLSGNEHTTTTAPRVRVIDASFSVSNCQIRNLNVSGNATGSEANDGLINIIVCAHT